MEQTDELMYLFKIIIIGDAGVGKSNILTRYTKNEFDSSKQPTVGVEFSSKKIKVDNKNIKLQIWDTAGQEKFKAVSKQYYKGADAVIVVYDITSTRSFRNVSNWMADVDSFASANVQKFLVGNKKDLSEHREVPLEEGKTTAQCFGAYFIETSAVSNQDYAIEQIFKILANKIVDERRRVEESVDPSTARRRLNEPVSLGRPEQPVEAVGSEKSTCCS